MEPGPKCLYPVIPQPDRLADAKLVEGCIIDKWWGKPYNKCYKATVVEVFDGSEYEGADHAPGVFWCTIKYFYDSEQEDCTWEDIFCSPKTCKVTRLSFEARRSLLGTAAPQIAARKRAGRHSPEREADTSRESEEVEKLSGTRLGHDHGACHRHDLGDPPAMKKPGRMNSPAGNSSL